jgi:hypothetical protein
MKNIILFMFYVLSSSVLAQDFKKDSVSYQKIKVEQGLYIPLGNLATIMGTTHYTGLWYRKQIPHKDILELGGRILITEEKNNFYYKENDTIYNPETRAFGFVLGANLLKRYDKEFLNQHVKIEWITSVGIHFLGFKDPQSKSNDTKKYQPEENTTVIVIDTETKFLTSPYLGQGIGLSGQKFGVQAGYNYIPFARFSKQIKENFGSGCLVISIHYKFLKK